MTSNIKPSVSKWTTSIFDKNKVEYQSGWWLGHPSEKYELVNWMMKFPIYGKANYTRAIHPKPGDRWAAGLPCPKNAEDGSQGCIVRTLFVGAAQTSGCGIAISFLTKMYPYLILSAPEKIALNHQQHESCWTRLSCRNSLMNLQSQSQSSFWLRYLFWRNVFEHVAQNCR